MAVHPVNAIFIELCLLYNDLAIMLSAIMLSAIMLSVIMPSVIMLSVNMLSVIILSVIYAESRIFYC